MDRTAGGFHRMQGPAIYRFAGFELDTLRRRLTGPNGSLCAISSRGYDALLYLVKNRARVVGKDELMKAVWPRTVVEENNLTQAVSSARRALGDSRDSPRFILTVAGRGYQFVGETSAKEATRSVTADELGEAPALSALEPAAGQAIGVEEPGLAGPTPQPEDSQVAEFGTPSVNRRRLLVALGAGTAAIAAGVYGWKRTRGTDPSRPRSLAVLPFRPLTDDHGDAAIEIGIADLLINRLSTVPALSVTPLSSVIASNTSDRDPLAYARDLGVEAVLDGHVQMRDGRIRLTARLIDVRSGKPLWAGDFTERLDDFFAVQDSLASQLMNELVPNLPVEVRQRSLQHHTVDVEAWQLYANGRYHVARRNEASVRKAIEYFAAAERVDPRFALASAGLSEAWAMMAVFGIEPPAEALAQARDAARRALAADPRLPEGLTAIGQVVTQFDRDLDGGRDYYRRAIQLRPDLALAHAYLALSLTMGGEAARARASIVRAQQIEPASLVYRSIGGLVAYFARDYVEAERHLESVARTAPDAPLPRQFLARVLLAQDRGAEALALLDGRNDPAPGAYSNLGRALAQVGRQAEALEEAGKLERLRERGFGVGFDLALLRLEIGDAEATLDALEWAVADHSQMGAYVNVEPALDPVRGDPRFAAIAARMFGG